MKIKFDPQGYNFVEIKRNIKKFIITLSSKDPADSYKTIINSVELTEEELLELLSDLNILS